MSTFHLQASEEFTVMINDLCYSGEMDKHSQGGSCPKTHNKSLGEPGKLSKTIGLCSH